MNAVVGTSYTRRGGMPCWLCWFSSINCAAMRRLRMRCRLLFSIAPKYRSKYSGIWGYVSKCAHPAARLSFNLSLRRNDFLSVDRFRGIMSTYVSTVQGGRLIQASPHPRLLEVDLKWAKYIVYAGAVLFRTSFRTPNRGANLGTCSCKGDSSHRANLREQGRQSPPIHPVGCALRRIYVPR